MTDDTQWHTSVAINGVVVTHSCADEIGAMLKASEMYEQLSENDRESIKTEYQNDTWGDTDTGIVIWKGVYNEKENAVEQIFDNMWYHLFEFYAPVTS